MDPRQHQWTTFVVLTVIAAVSLTACSSTPAGSPVASTQASVVGGSTPAATPAPPAAGVSVDLVFSGTLALTAKGSAGQCTLGHSLADGSITFGFGATEADYPGLGQGFYLTEGAGLLQDKWLTVAGGVGYVGNLPDGSYTFSSDHKSVTLDADVSEGNQPTEHVSGTISCP